MTTDRIKGLVETLGLKQMNLESGLFTVVSVSDLLDEKGHPASNSIYVMLTREYPQSYLHRMESDDIQILIEGGPIDYYLFYANGEADKITLGKDLAQDQQMIVACPGGTAKALILHDDVEYALIASVVAPAWSPSNVVYGATDEFIDTYAGKADWAKADFLKYLVGPNYGHVTGGASQDDEIAIDAEGQIIWQGMQMTEKQLVQELSRFSSKTVQLNVDDQAPANVIEQVKQLINAAGLSPD